MVNLAGLDRNALNKNLQKFDDQNADNTIEASTQATGESQKKELALSNQRQKPQISQ